MVVVGWCKPSFNLILVVSYIIAYSSYIRIETIIHTELPISSVGLCLWQPKGRVSAEGKMYI